jgi:hypothetical protein
MMRCTSRVKINQRALNRLSGAAVRALEMTAEALHTEEVQAQVIPRKTGTLQGEAFFVDKSESASGRVSLVNSTPYARRIYYHPEYHFHTEPWEEGEGNPNAEGKWHEEWMKGGDKEKFVPGTFERIYRRMIGQ